MVLKSFDNTQLLARTATPLVQGRAPVAAWLLAGLAAAACSGPDKVSTTMEGPVASQCRKQFAAHERDVKELTYLPPALQTLRWALPGADADGLISEATLVQALRGGQIKFAHVQARGGIGKTELAKALVAQTCGQVPAFRVDLREIYGPTAPALAAGSNGIAVDVAKQLQLSAGQTLATAGLDRLLLAIDHVEEVTDRRAQALADLGELRKEHPAWQVVVMGRPSIDLPFYGLQGLDAVLELPPLDCGRANSSLVRLSDDAAERHRVDGFVKTWHLDHQSMNGQQCYYPYLATYRDIQVVQRLAKTFNPDTEMGGLQANLSQVHETILAERLIKELEDLKMTGEQVLAAVDAMVALGAYQDGEWNLTFTLDRCLKGQGADAARGRVVCEKLFQSVLFDHIAGTGEAKPDAAQGPALKAAEWKFAHQDIADLFVARWLEGQLQKTPKACTAVDQQVDMIAGKTIAGYLVGRPGGVRCLGPIAKAVCKDGGFQKSRVGLFYKGLPLGAQRSEWVKQAKDWLQANGNDACALQYLNAM